MINGDSYQHVERVLEEALIPEADVRETAQIVDVPSPWLWCPDHLPPVGIPVITLDQGMPLLDAEVHVATASWQGVECWWMPLPAPPDGWAERMLPQEQASTSPDTALDTKEDPAMDALQTGGMLGYAPRSHSTDENTGEVRPDRRAENALRQAAPVALGALTMLDLITSEGGDDVFHGMSRDRQEAYLAEIYNVVQRCHDCMVAFQEQSA